MEPKSYREMAILVVQGVALDYDYIARWAQDIGASELWNQVLSEYRRRSNQASSVQSSTV